MVGAPIVLAFLRKSDCDHHEAARLQLSIAASHDVLRKRMTEDMQFGICRLTRSIIGPTGLAYSHATSAVAG